MFALKSLTSNQTWLCSTISLAYSIAHNMDHAFYWKLIDTQTGKLIACHINK